jgi:hypothetical protein
MTLSFRLFLFAILLFFGAASTTFARLPENRSERSLLYWRYLCRGEKQEETLAQDTRELKCFSQNWTVRTPASSGVVKEIIDENP